MGSEASICDQSSAFQSIGDERNDVLHIQAFFPNRDKQKISLHHRFSYSRQILIIWLGDQDMSWLCGLSGL